MRPAKKSICRIVLFFQLIFCRTSTSAALLLTTRVSRPLLLRSVLLLLPLKVILASRPPVPESMRTRQLHTPRPRDEGMRDEDQGVGYHAFASHSNSKSAPHGHTAQPSGNGRRFSHSVSVCPSWPSAGRDPQPPLRP